MDKLIQAFASAFSSYPNIHLVIIGDEREKQDMQQLSHLLNISQQVHFLGYRRDVPSLLSDIDAFVNLTQSEAGISAAQLEAMHAGLPSIVTPFSPYLTHMKEAIVVNGNDIAAVSKALFLLYIQPVLYCQLDFPGL